MTIAIQHTMIVVLKINSIFVLFRIETMFHTNLYYKTSSFNYSNTFFSSCVSYHFTLNWLCSQSTIGTIYWLRSSLESRSIVHHISLCCPRSKYVFVCGKWSSSEWSSHKLHACFVIHLYIALLPER